MPSYYNPYNFYPVGYANQMGYSGIQQPIMQSQTIPQQSFATGPNCAMAWVDGEIEARGRQMPQGVTQFAMWDTNRQVIYLKSLNQMGMPNPMAILHYTVEEAQGNLPAGQSGAASPQGGAQQEQTHAQAVQSQPQPDLSQYVTKDDLAEMRNEIRNMMAQQSQAISGMTAAVGNQNQNGSENRGNRNEGNSGNRGGGR